MQPASGDETLTRQSLWHHRPFLSLWLDQSISLAGSQVTALALPLTALLVLHATAFEMGLLGAVQILPDLLLSLVTGVWVDRVRRRPLLIGADVGRAVLLATIPLAATLKFLTLQQLYVVRFFPRSVQYCSVFPITTAGVMSATMSGTLSGGAA